MAKGSLNYEKVVNDIPEPLRPLILFAFSKPEYSAKLILALLQRIKEDDFSITSDDFAYEQMNMASIYFNDDGVEGADNR